jgi:aldehyde:ferredoxin oxidoreductase
MEMFEKIGNLPVRNFRDGLFPDVPKITGVVIKDTIRIGMEGCYACPARCKKIVKCDEPYKVDPAYGGPEYETLASFGSNCGISDIKAICKANERCGAYSLDTISTGGVIAFAMECFEKGLITTRDTGGIELKFGNTEAMLQAIELIARREGIGNMLAEGTAQMAKKIGHDSIKFAMNSKGLEAGYHDPRANKNIGLSFMVNPAGADHSLPMPARAMATEAGIKEIYPLGRIEIPPANEFGPLNVDIVMLAQFKAILADSLVICMFLPYTLQDQAELVQAVTGWDTGTGEMVRIAERITTLQKLFNVREGFTITDDTLPERFYEPKTDGILSDKPLDRAQMEKARRTYYALMGWDVNTGVPLPEKVEALGIK